MSQAPIVHLNGSSREDLFQQLSDVVMSLMKTRKYMALAYPHARDYYVKEGAYETAASEWDHRMTQIEAMIADVRGLAEQVIRSDQ